MKKNLFRALCVLLAASMFGCGKKDEATSTQQSQGTYVSFPIPGQPNGSSVAPQILGAYPYFFVNYRVDEAGCSTGWRRFSGNDAGYVRALMCQSFRNDQMNQNCGRAQRDMWFAAVCQGF